MTDRGNSKRGYCGQGDSSVNRRVAAKRHLGALEMPFIHRRPAIFGSSPCQRLVHDISTVEPPRGRIGGLDEYKGIAGAAALASPGPENRAMLPVLTDASDGERTAGNVEGGAESSSESVKLRALQCDLNRSITTHREADNRSRAPFRDSGKACFHVND